MYYAYLKIFFLFYILKLYWSSCKIQVSDSDKVHKFVSQASKLILAFWLSLISEEIQLIYIPQKMLCFIRKIKMVIKFIVVNTISEHVS